MTLIQLRFQTKFKSNTERYKDKIIAQKPHALRTDNVAVAPLFFYHPIQNQNVPGMQTVIKTAKKNPHQ